MKLSLKILLPIFLALLACQSIIGMEEAPSAPKKRKEAEESSQKQQVIQCPRAFFNSKEIEDLISKLMVEEKGKILAAYYMVTSEALSSWWANRKYIQEFRKADMTSDIQKITQLERYKTSPKEDVLIVDEESQNYPAVKKISNSGILVLVRNKKREPSNNRQKMHHKFIVFFDEDDKKGKFAIIGSYNMTEQAQYNFEDATIFNNTELIAQFIQKHHELRQYCTDYKKLQPKSPPASPIKPAITQTTQTIAPSTPIARPPAPQQIQAPNNQNLTPPISRKTLHVEEEEDINVASIVSEHLN